MKRSRIIIGQDRRTISLTPRELFFYVMFAIFRLEARAGDGAVSLFQLQRTDFDRTFRRITAARSKEIGLDKSFVYPGFGFLEKMASQLASARQISEFLSKFYTLNARIKEKLDGLPEQFALTSREDRGKACYQLPIPPERIKFI